MPYYTDGSSALAPDDDFMGSDGDFDGDSALDDSWTRDASGGAHRRGSDGDGKIIDFNDAKAKHDRREAAKKKAGDGEKSASGAGDNLSGKAAGGLDAAKKAEGAAGAAGAGFTSKVGGKAAGAAIPGGQIAVQKLKKMGPFGMVLIVLGICMGVFSASTAMAPFGLINNLMDNFNVMRTSMNTRSNNLMPRMISSGRNTSIVRTSIFGRQKFKLSHRQESKFLKNGVFFDRTNRILVYVDPDTDEVFGISADERTKTNIPDGEIDIVDADGNPRKVTIDSEHRRTYSDMLDNNDNFFEANDKSTRTLKGHIAAWFDSVSEKFHKRIVNSRNRQRTTSAGADDEEIEQHAKATGMDDDAEGTSDLNVGEEQEVDDGHGGKTTVETEEAARKAQMSGDDVDGIPDTSNSDGALKPGMSSSEIETSLTARAKTAAAQLGKLSSALSAMAMGCAALKILNSIVQTIVGLQRAQVINFGTGMFEAIQKTQSGDASTEWSFYGNKMMQPDENGETAWGSAGINQAFSDGKVIVQDNDPYARQLSVTYMTENVFGASFGGSIGNAIAGAGGTLATYKQCVTLQALSGIASIAADAVDVVATVLSSGISVIFKWLGKKLLAAAQMAAIIGSIMFIISKVLVPKVVDMFKQDLITASTRGPILGYATDDAANAYQGGQMQAASGIPGSQPMVMAQYQATQEVIASEARYIQLTRSPFDVSTKYTFLGSIVNSVTPIAMSLRQPLSVISGTANLLGNAIKALSPTANALNYLGIKTSLSTKCGPLSQVVDSQGNPLVCDAYGNPYFVTNLTTMGNDPADVMDVASKYVEGGVTLWYWDQYDVEHVLYNQTAERKNFVDGYYGDFSNHDVTAMKRAGYVYDKNEQIFYGGKSSDGVWRFLQKDGNDDGESADAANPQIKEHSELANYVVSCMVRESQYGQEDSRISQYVLGKTGSTMEQMTDTAIGMIPFVGDYIQIRDADREAKNVMWVSGENCPKDEYRFYSRYSEDQRWLESTEIIASSAVTSFLDNYYEENPLDNSFEGIIARYSGQTKEDVELALGLLEYEAYVAHYDATGLGPLKEAPTKQNYVYDSMTIVAQAVPDAISPKYIVFDELRNRTWTV